MNLRHAWHRVVGAALVALTVIPIHRILEGRQIGFSGRDIMAAAERAWELLLLGTIIVLPLGFLASRVLTWDKLRAWLARGAELVSRPSRAAFALAMGAVATAITAVFALLALQGKPNLVDAMVQSLQGRFVAEGMLAGPHVPPTSFWHMSNSVVTEGGWVSHFPPGFPVLLGAGHLLGAPWLVTALLAGFAVLCTALAAERLLPDQRAVARFGAILAAQSPFIIGLAGAQMNHVAAGAFIAFAVYATTRGVQSGGALWAVLSGAGLGAAFAIRPLAAVVAAAPVLFIAFAAPVERTWRQRAGQVALGLLGALPFGIGTALYNSHFFGRATRFGYEFAWGPDVGLGFRVDPWGNVFGPIEAIGYTATDLTTLGLFLLETPISAVAMVGTFLLVAPRLSFGAKAFALWALLPLVANFFYWHHGVFMGPRMLNEVAPAWCILVAMSAAGIVQRIPPAANFSGYYWRTAVTVSFALSFAFGMLYQSPERLIGYRVFIPSSRIAPPDAPDSSLVFVHGAWTSRITMRLASAGMRLDSIETLMRKNPTCDADALSKLFVERPREAMATMEALDFDPEGEALESVSVRDEYRIRPGQRPFTPECSRELNADRLGTADVSPMLWQVRVPGLRRGGAIVVRDMGPEDNAELMAYYPTLVPLMYYRPQPDAEPVLAPYLDAARVLWGDGGGLVRSAATSSNANAD